MGMREPGSLGRGVADPLCPIYVLPHAPNFVALGQTVWTYIRGSQKFGGRWAPPASGFRLDRLMECGLYWMTLITFYCG